MKELPGLVFQSTPGRAWRLDRQKGRPVGAPCILLSVLLSGLLSGPVSATSSENSLPGLLPSPPPAVATTGLSPDSAPAGEKAGHRPASLPPAISPEEARLGKDGAAEVLKEYDVIKDPAENQKVRMMVQTLEKGTPYPDLPYTVTIVKAKHPDPEPEINAFSLPGGYIYVTQDLINATQSDDELAAVLGHEMAHVVHHHVVRQIHEENRNRLISLLVLVGDLLASGANRGGEGAAGAAIMSQQVVQALQSPHSIHDETEADMSGIDYLYRTHKYNPVGMLTFMQRLALIERHHPDIELGYLQTHPSSSHRVEDIRDRLDALHVDDSTRAIRSVTHALKATVDAVSAGGVARVQMKGTTICSFVERLNGLSAAQRAQAASYNINAGLDDSRPLGGLSARMMNGLETVVWDGRPLFQITAQDAALDRTSPEQAGDRAVHAIQKMIWADEVANS